MRGRTPESSHQGFPVVDEQGIVAGVVTRRQTAGREHPRRPTAQRPARRARRSSCYADSTLRDAADHMVNHDIGRLPVVERGQPGVLVGIITRSDLLSAHRQRLRETARGRPHADPPAPPLAPRRRQRDRRADGGGADVASIPRNGAAPSPLYSGERAGVRGRSRGRCGANCHAFFRKAPSPYPSPPRTGKRGSIPAPDGSSLYIGYASPP